MKGSILLQLLELSQCLLEVVGFTPTIEQVHEEGFTGLGGRCIQADHLLEDANGVLGLAASLQQFAQGHHGVGVVGISGHGLAIGLDGLVMLVEPVVAAGRNASGRRAQGGILQIEMLNRGKRLIPLAAMDVQVGHADHRRYEVRVRRDGAGVQGAGIIGAVKSIGQPGKAVVGGGFHGDLGGLRRGGRAARRGTGQGLADHACGVIGAHLGEFGHGLARIGRLAGQLSRDGPHPLARMALYAMDGDQFPPCFHGIGMFDQQLVQHLDGAGELLRRNQCVGIEYAQIHAIGMVGHALGDGGESAVGMAGGVEDGQQQFGRGGVRLLGGHVLNGLLFGRIKATGANQVLDQTHAQSGIALVQPGRTGQHVRSGSVLLKGFVCVGEGQQRCRAFHAHEGGQFRVVRRLRT